MDCIQVVAYESLFFLLPGEEISTRGQRPHLDDPRWCAKDQKGRVLQAGSPITSTYLRTQVDGSEVTSRKVMRSKSQCATAILSATLTKNAMISVLYAAKPRDAVMKPCFEKQY